MVVWIVFKDDVIHRGDDVYKGRRSNSTLLFRWDHSIYFELLSVIVYLWSHAGQFWKLSLFEIHSEYEYESAYADKVSQMNDFICKLCSDLSWILAMIVLHLSTWERPMCFDISEVCALSPLLQHPSSRVHVQLQHVEQPGVLLCTSDKLFDINMACITKSSSRISLLYWYKSSQTLFIQRYSRQKLSHDSLRVE